VRIDALLDRVASTSASGPIDILFFAATPLDDREEPLVPFAWMPIDELALLRFPPANTGVLTRLTQGGS
jgi:hypothetical protein